MKLKHYYSDWNGQRSEDPYLKTPKPYEIDHALALGKYRREENEIIFADKENKIVEVKKFVGNDITGNLYRDMYQLIN
jgi:hypothetical protein